MNKKEETIKTISKDTLVRAIVLSGSIFLLVLVLLGFVYWFVFSKYDVSLAPKQHAVVEKGMQATSSDVSTLETTQQVVQGSVGDKELNEQSFKAGGKVEEKEEEVTLLDYEYGLALGATLSYMEEREVGMVLDDIASLNVGWIRCDLSWNSIQNRSKDVSDWSSFDRIVELASERNIKVLPILTYTPVWARKEECKYTSKCPPADIAVFAEFVGRAVERYEPMGVDTWEIWNEPNIAKFWAGGVSAQMYTQLLKVSYRTIHEIDGDATVVSGGLAPADTTDTDIAPREYLERMYENGAQGFFDALGFHPHSFPLSPTEAGSTNAWTQMNDTSWSLRSIMKKNGDGGKDIWVTEYGAPTGGPGKVADGNSVFSWSTPTHVTEEFQAEIYREAYEYKEESDWMGPIFWYSYRDIGVDEDDIENHFGIIEFDGTHKEAYEVVQEATK